MKSTSFKQFIFIDKAQIHLWVDQKQRELSLKEDKACHLTCYKN